MWLELRELVRVVEDERATAEVERVTQVMIPLDRMGVDAALGMDIEHPHEINLARRGEVEAGALVSQRAHDRGMRKRLQRE